MFSGGSDTCLDLLDGEGTGTGISTLDANSPKECGVHSYKHQDCDLDLKIHPKRPHTVSSVIWIGFCRSFSNKGCHRDCFPRQILDNSPQPMIDAFWPKGQKRDEKGKRGEIKQPKRELGLKY